MLSLEQAKQRIVEAFADCGLSPETIDDVAFHMTDWKEDLDTIRQVYEQPDLTNDQVQQIILKFLAHAPNHVAAAKKLVGLGPIEDVFGVGVLEEDLDDE